MATGIGAQNDELLRVDVISDTHGHLSDELLRELKGADRIMHAGDCCVLDDYLVLNEIAPVTMCLGNNDWGMDYGPSVKRLTTTFFCGLRWQLCHYEERLDLATCDVAICGHTHRPFIRWEKSPGGSGKVLVINPGSPTFPRTAEGPTMARMLVRRGGTIEHVEIVRLRPENDEDGDRWSFSRLFRR